LKEAKAKSYTIILGDLEKGVLERAKEHPTIKEHLKEGSKPLVLLKHLNAVDMETIDDNSLDGIGASALLHEVYSYCTEMGSIDQFLSEVCRTLKPDGVFIYRDPVCLDDAERYSFFRMRTKFLRQFFNIFILKFIENEYSQITKKPSNYDVDRITITATIKGEVKKKVTLTKFFEIT
jgi:Methylase involved in ubiquinone/menaquinone biosynthesis